MAKLTPMMEQYFQIKNKYKDCILFYRLGDFYEMWSGRKGAYVWGAFPFL